MVGEVLLMTLPFDLWGAGRLKMDGRVWKSSVRLQNHELGSNAYRRTFKEME